MITKLSTLFFNINVVNVETYKVKSHVHFGPITVL